MALDKDVSLARLVASQHGVFTGRHASDRTFTRNEIAYRAAAGLWERLYDDVFRLTGVPPTWEGDVLAACWAGGFRAVASRRSAAALHGLPGGSRDLVEITCPRWRRARHDRLVVHETKVLDPFDMTLVGVIPVTTVTRTLLDLGAVCSPRLVELAVESALRRRLTTMPQLRATLARLGRSGRNGAGTLRSLVDARDIGSRPTESEMETLLLQALRAHGLPEPVRQHEVFWGSSFVARVDAAYPAARVAIEYDSDQFHTGRVATAADSARRHRLIAAGYLPITVVHEDLRRGGATACAAIAAALRARRRTA